MNPATRQHLQQLGLDRSPFPPTPDSAAYFQTDALERELVEATHCLRTRSGFVLLTGEVGTGKTTFLRRLMSTLEREDMVVSLVFNTYLQGNDLLAAVLRDFGLPAEGSAADNIDRLNRFLLERWQRQTTCVLLIDDAQNLDIESLELLRLLTCLESGQEKLLQIVLAGQPELLQVLAQPAIRQLSSRISKHAQLCALAPDRTGEYVRFRLDSAGADGAIALDEAAITALHRASNGNPRHIHQIMDRCLYGLYGQAAGPRRIDAALIRTAAAEAGVQRRARARRYPWALAASLGGLLAVGGLVLSLRPGDTHAEPASTVASAPPAAASATTAPPPQHCLARLGDGARRQVQVPSGAAPYLRQHDDLCVQATAQGALVTFVPRVPDADLLQQQPNTRLQQLQYRLRQQGHYDGQLDGRFGPLTQRALRRMQQHNALPATGTPDALTLHLLALPAAHADSPNDMDPSRNGHG